MCSVGRDRDRRLDRRRQSPIVVTYLVANHRVVEEEEHMVNLQPSDLQSKARDAVLKYPHRCPHPPAFSLRRYIGALNRSPVRPLHGRTLPLLRQELGRLQNVSLQLSDVTKRTFRLRPSFRHLLLRQLDDAK